MAKKTKKRASKELTRKQRSRLERDLRMERILKWSVAAVVAVVVIILAYGFITENVIKARQAVATVDGVAITTSDFQARVRFLRMQMSSELQRLFQQQGTLDPTDSEVQFLLEYLQNNISELQSQLAPENALIIGDGALDQLIEGELVRQEAERRGIAVSAEELQEAVEQDFGYERNPATPTVTAPVTQTDELGVEPAPTPMTEEDFRQRYDNSIQAINTLDISEAQFRSWFESSLLFEKLQEQMDDQVPTSADQVKLLYLSVDDVEWANSVVAQLDAGGDFQELIDEFQTNEQVSAYGDELDWFPRDVLERNLNVELADLAFSLEVDAHSDAVSLQDGMQYVIIKVIGREERELEQSVREQLGAGIFDEWLESQQSLVVRLTYRDRVPTDP